MGNLLELCLWGMFVSDNANLANVLDELLRDGEPNQNNGGAAGEEANNEESGPSSDYSEDSEDTSDMERLSVDMFSNSDSDDDNDELLELDMSNVM